jgi:phosphatidylinositol alpha-mannosyltransferase
MKIALVSPYDFPYPGGVTEHIIALASGLRQRGHEVHILAASSGYQNQTFLNTQIVTRTVTSIPVGGTVARVGLSPRSYFRIKRILQQEAFDVIHLQEPLTPGITWSVLGQTQTLSNTVTIGTFHAYHEQPHWLYRYGKPVFRKFFTRLDSLIAVSEAARCFANDMFPGEYQIIPNGIDLKRFGKRGKIEKNGKPLTILFVGRLDRRKGFSYLLDSFFELKPDYPQLQLNVIGPFAAKDYTAYHHIDGLKFVGYVPPERLPDFYHQADIFCAPSVGFESFGMVLLEAMAAGLPLVASDIAGYRTLLSPDEEGILVPPHQPHALESALRYLIDHPQQRQAMGQRGQLKAGRYSWDHIVNRVLGLYHSTLEWKRKKTNLPASRFSPEVGAT